MKASTFRRVYVWELPVRLFHWINALCILVLCITGYLIGNPPAIQSAAEATYGYWFGINRFIHFATAYIFLFNLLIRIYWSFVGNKYASWRNIIPTNLKFFKNIIHVLKLDILLLKGKEKVVAGHNPLAGFSYFFLLLACLLMVFTGFGLYAPMSDWWFPNLFAWVSGLVGGEFILREIHHAIMWFIIVFTIIHLYLVYFHDRVEGRGETSSMVSGYKFMEEEVFEEAKRRNVAEAILE